MLLFTSCTVNYLPKARVLAKSAKVHNPDWQFCLLLAECPPDDFDLNSEPFDRLLTLEDLHIPNLKAWVFGHRLVELCTAIKGIALNHFLEKERQPEVMYLDPDVWVLNPLDPLAQMLKKHDILLTPHQLAPQSGARAIEDNEICSLRHGVFNLGFLACANRTEGVAFSRFWRHRLENYCRDDKFNGLFTDQKWCDLAPAYFPSLGIVRDPGCNAASWNLTDRCISQDETGQFLANGQPLRFYHFTGYDSGMGRIMSEVYGGDMPAVSELWKRYDAAIQEAGQSKYGKMPWSGGFYSDGTAISDEARLYYREDAAIRSLYPDAYWTGGGQGFAVYWREHMARETNMLYVWTRKPFRLARLAYLYLRSKGGLKALPRLSRKVWETFRDSGTAGVLAKIRRFKHHCASADITLQHLLKPSTTLGYWASALRKAFSPGVLILDHMYGGGANDYREQRLREFLEDGRPCLLATWDFFGRRLRLSFHLPDGRKLDAEAADLENLLKQAKFTFNHILLNELVLWSTSRTSSGPQHYNALPELLRVITALKYKNNAHLEVAIHDFYPICPSYNLLERGMQFCKVSKDMQRCAACLQAGPFDVAPDFDLSRWREAWREFLANADELKVFSLATADLLGLCYPGTRNGQVVHAPHKPLNILPKVAIAPGPLSIAVVGHVAPHKGARVVRDLAEMLDGNEKLTVIGSLNGQVPANVRITGIYAREQLPELMEQHGINCCLVPSIWPETFCYVVQEIMQMGLPLVVFPLGAQAERVKSYERGAIASEINAAAALAALRQLHKSCV